MRRWANVVLWLGCAAALLGTTQPWWSAGERTSVSGTQATSGAALAVILAGTSPLGARLFSDDPAVRSRLIAGLLILAVMQLPGAVAFALDGALIGAEDERWLAGRAVRNLVGFAPLAMATLLYPGLGLGGLWGAQLMWMVLRAWVNHRRWVGLGALDVSRSAPTPAVTG